MRATPREKMAVLERVVEWTPDPVLRDDLKKLLEMWNDRAVRSKIEPWMERVLPYVVGNDGDFDAAVTNRILTNLDLHQESTTNLFYRDGASSPAHGARCRRRRRRKNWRRCGNISTPTPGSSCSTRKPSTSRTRISFLSVAALDDKSPEVRRAAVEFEGRQFFKARQFRVSRTRQPMAAVGSLGEKKFTALLSRPRERGAPCRNARLDAQNGFFRFGSTSRPAR